MLQTFLFGIIGLILTLFGLGFQQFTFFKQKGYKDLHFRWPLPTYGLLTLFGSIVMISSQECLFYSHYYFWGQFRDRQKRFDCWFSSGEDYPNISTTITSTKTTGLDSSSARVQNVVSNYQLRSHFYFQFTAFWFTRRHCFISSLPRSRLVKGLYN